MTLRDLALNNLRWKLGALIMAMLIWFIIQIAMSVGLKSPDHPLGDARARILVHRPVLVLSAPHDTLAYRITPSFVDVTVRSASRGLEKLGPDEVQVFVNLIDASTTGKLTKPLFLHLPGKFDLESVIVQPPTVMVERLLKPN